MSLYPDSCENNTTYQILKKGVTEIGEMVMAMQQSGNLGTTQKESIHSILTVADKEAESKLIDLIKSNFPENAILSEESFSENHTKTFWTIDPIDGTSFFEHGLRDWSINLSFVENNKIQFGMTYCPSVRELFFAEAGRGAFLNGKSIQVSSRDKLKDSIIYIGNKAFIQHIDTIHTLAKNIRSAWITGSTGLVLANLAAGRVDAAIQIEQPFWDIAPGILLVQEAGGMFTNWQGEEDFDMSGAYTQQNNIIASNGALHKSLLTLF
ncbi:MAG TPA: inositol monophosphatase [Candidatus Sulfotelmatobacter sp.]|jgi:myo-inositol-1(or 4)-monophosphatase|nr:inositol monophosphatase [Candidatus Sulfotelmatobacter sp.]